ncbi:MAG: hypothetical protein ACKVP7_14975 [Hyphomicrobiaceae bacterium]
MQTQSAVYDSYPHAERAVKALEAAGVPSSDISLVANKHVSEIYADFDVVSPTAAGASIGAAVGGGAGLLTGLGLLAIPGLGPVVAAGWLAATALGTVAGSATGGVVGALIGAGTSEDHAHVYSEAVRRGGTLVTVRHAEPNGRIEGILNASNPIDPAARRNEYGQGGWKEFDPKAPAYQPDQSEIERMRRSSI